MSEPWSAPDAQRIITLSLDVGAKRTMRGKRRRKSVRNEPEGLALLSANQKEVIRSWLKRTSVRRKWQKLLATSGFSNVLLAEELLKILLESGWVEIEEHRTQRGWEPVWIEFRAYEELREHLGLTNRDKQKAQADNLQGDFSTDELRIAAAQLDGFPAATKIKRHELLSGVENWIRDGLQGTRRDFSLYVRGRTKDITSNEWNWLETHLDLTSFGISTHTPLIRIKIPGALVFPEGQVDFRLLPGALGLAQEQIQRATAVVGEISCWKVVENLTSFERVVQSSAEKEGVIWVPGFAPSWWTQSVSHLISMTNAPGKVACDPDPAGLFIASQVGKVWEKQRLSWEPWLMAPSDFEGRGNFIKLSEHDTNLLITFLQRDGNHSELIELAKWFEGKGQKLEQESFVK